MHQNPKKRGVSFLSGTVVESQHCVGVTVSHCTGEGNVLYLMSRKDTDIIEYELKYADNHCVLLEQCGHTTGD